jgi:hypothetical protein
MSVHAPALEILSRLALIGSAGLYGIGLLIANFNAQLYGRYNLGFVEAQYVLVGLLWLLLTLFVFALTRSALRWMKGLGPWRGRPLGQNVKKGLQLALWWLSALGFYWWVISFLAPDDAYWSWRPLLTLGVLLASSLTLAGLFKETWQEVKTQSRPGDSFLLKLRKADSIQIVRQVLYFFTALSLYATLVYPRLSPAVGGGRLHEAQIIIRQDRRSLFDNMADFRIDKSGKLGPVRIVSESDQSLIVTAPEKPWWEVRPPSLLLKKDLIELVIYTK